MIQLRPENMPIEVEHALEHIQKYHPEICMVLFSELGYWRYMDVHMNAPAFNFSEEIDVTILKKAVDAVEELPALFYRGVSGVHFCEKCNTLLEYPDSRCDCIYKENLNV